MGHPRIRVALLPIGAFEPSWFMREQHMNPDDAVQALALCGAEEALGHLEHVPVDRRGHRRAAQHLAEALVRHDVRPERFRAIPPGEIWQI